MIRRLRDSLWCVLLLAVASAVSAQTPNYTRPKVRAITAFVRLQRASYAPQIAEALKILRAAEQEFQHQGYEVETLRIVTQPLPELLAGQSDAEALAFLKALDDLSVKETFIPNVGPAMQVSFTDKSSRALRKASASASD